MELKRYDYAIQRLLPDLLFNMNSMKMLDLDQAASAGDLVMLQSAPDSEWHLSIYHEDCGDGYHLLESLKTGKMMRWGNVGILRLSRKWVEDHEPLRWSNAQFSFSRMFDAERRKGDFYMHLPFLTEFGPEFFRIGTRTRFCLDEKRTVSELMRWADMPRAKLRAAMAKQVQLHAAANNPSADPSETR